MKYILQICFAFLSIVAKGANYYLSSLAGDDYRTAIQAQDSLTPWKTIEKLNTFTGLQPGDSIFFKRREFFYGTINSHSSGNPTKAIFFGSYGTGSNPVITGLTTISNWTLQGGNIYFAPLDVPNLNMVIVNGTVQGMGRYPNSGYLSYESHVNNTGIRDNQLQAVPNWTNAEVVIKKYRWIIDRHIITRHTGNLLTYNSLASYGNNNAYTPVDGNGYFIQNHIGTLDQQGEWYYDAYNKKIYMYFAGGTPNTYNVKVSTQDKNAILNDRTNVDFRNLDFEGANTAGVSLINCQSITFTECNFLNQGGVSLYGGMLDYITVQNCYLKNSLSNGIFFEYESHHCTIDNVTVENTNTISGSGRSGDGVGTGISITGNNNIVKKNRVVNSGYNGIEFAGDNILVEKNFVDSFCVIKDDGGGIYTYQGLTVTNSNRIVRNNIILNAVGAYAGAESYYYEAYGKAAGIYLDGYSNNVELTGNTVANGEWAGIFIHNNFAHRLLNNTVFNTGRQLYISAYDGQVHNLVWRNNKLIAKTPAQSTLLIETYVNNSIASMATADSNYYARPFEDSATISVDNRYSGGNGLVGHTLTQWQSTYGEDVNSKKSPVSPVSYNDIVFAYNSSTKNKTVALDGKYVDVEGNEYAVSVTLEPYTSVVLMKRTNIPLPMRMLSLRAFTHNKGNTVQWEVVSETAMEKYCVEKSVNGQTFITATAIAARNTDGVNAYNWFDEEPGKDDAYYRIRSVGKDGSIRYSSVVRIRPLYKKQDMRIYPNPLADEAFHVQLDNLPKGIYTLELINDAGQKVEKYKLENSGTSAAQTIFMQRHLRPGTYKAVLTGKEKAFAQSLIKL